MKYLSKDQSTQNETTIYWFDKSGETFGVAESCGDVDLLDVDGYPVGPHQQDKDEFFNAVTDEMRSDY